MNRIKLGALIATGATCALAVTILLQPPSPAYNFSFAQLVFIGVMHVLAAIFLLTSFKGFKRRFKHAYLWLGISFITLAIGMVQYPIIGALNAFDSVYVTSGAGAIPFLLTAVFSFFGIVTIAKTVDVKSIFTSPWVVFGGALALGVAAYYLIPSPRVDLPPDALKFTLGLYTLEAALITFQVIVLSKTVATVGTMYKKALRWMLASNVFVFVGGVGYVVSQALVPFDDPYNYLSIGTIPYVFSSLLLIGAAVAFSQLAYAEQELAKAIPTDKTLRSFDIITLMATFASNPSQLAPVLDEFRVLTAKLDENTKLDEKQQLKMAQIYKNVEDFLVNKEPAREFSADGLRELVEIRFKGTVNEPAFWQAIQK